MFRRTFCVRKLVLEPSIGIVVGKAFLSIPVGVHSLDHGIELRSPLLFNASVARNDELARIDELAALFDAEVKMGPVAVPVAPT